ncbi:hypothetical protein DSO57_1014059 [Entomophthora muscae]|uniref:Uncharacterized protein n=1 Tax=Entomophthora muscae TaxID=34485 RepID=A0ACC2SV69_9FUNG|nr:hypothetical protein DSO57_1014059 [Entomophthora muscae]
MFSLQVQGFQCLEMLSTSTLLQLAAVLSNAIGVSPAAEHRFENKHLDLDYVSVTDPNHHDGWLTCVAHGIFLSHPHPHEPLAKGASLTFPITQVRSQQMWSLDLAFTKASPTLLFHHPEVTEPITITLISKRSPTSDDVRQLLTDDQCTMCAMSNCTEECGALTGMPCCDFCIRPVHQGWYGQMSPECHAHITKLTLEARQYIHHEYKTFFHASKANLPFTCLWVESTGEPCAFCTEGFL